MRDALVMFDRLVTFTNGNLSLKDVSINLNTLDIDTYFKFSELIFSSTIPEILIKYNETWISEAQKTIEFIKKFKINPKVIIDIGSCWGEFSMILAKEYNNSKVYSIEGSYQNFKVLNNNIALEINNINNIKTYNYIISNLDGQKYIDNKKATEKCVTHTGTTSCY